MVHVPPQDSLIIDDKPATARIDDIAFAWSFDDGINNQHSIDWKDIVCVYPDAVAGDQERCVLYTKTEAAKEESTNVRSLSRVYLGALGELSSSFDEYTPSQHSAWFALPSVVPDDEDRHVIVSTCSGTGTAETVWRQLVRPLLDHFGYDRIKRYQIHTTTSAKSISEWVQTTLLPKAGSGTKQSLLLLSGDGGIVDIVNGLLSGTRSATYRKPTISLLPLGTGNALANSSALTGDNTFGLRAVMQGSPKELPLFRVTFSPGARLLIDEGRMEEELQGSVDDKPVAHGAVVCSWGHHAALVADSDTTEYRKFGSERFKMAAKEALFPADGSTPHAYKGKVSVREPGKGWEEIGTGAHGYVLATFCGQLEAGFTISPLSKPLDGKLRLVHFGDLSGQDAMEVMTKAFQGGKHVEDNRVSYVEIEGLRVEVNEEDARWRRFCIDGKIIAVEEGGWVEVSTDVDGVVDLVCRDT